MKISLRPHHFLCLQGYKGFNYSKIQAQYWNKMSKELAKTPDADILIIYGKDDLCKKCPVVLSPAKSSCHDTYVNKLDKIVADLLGLNKGDVYKYSDISAKIEQKFSHNLHEELCSECAWWKKGLCKDLFIK